MDRHYVRAIEAAWSKIVGRPIVVSPREYAAIDAWRRRGVPLAIVLEVLNAESRRRTGRLPRSLSSLRHPVEEAWSAVAGGRAAAGTPALFPPGPTAREAWGSALHSIPEATPLRALLERLLKAEGEGASPEALDAELDAALPEAVPRAERERETEEASRDLSGFRRRMSADEFRATLARALADRLRSSLALPRLSITR